MANGPSLLLLASASTATGGDREEEDPSSQQRADRRPGPGNAAPLVCGGRGGCKGKTHRMLTGFILQSLNIQSLWEANVENNNSYLIDSVCKLEVNILFINMFHTRDC